MPTLKVITEAREFEALEADWRRIYEECGASNPFLSYEWLTAWWRHFGEGKQLSVVVVELNGDTVAIAPLMRVKSAGITKLQFLGKPISDYSDFLIGKEGEHCVGPLVQFIQREMQWDAVELRGITNDSPNLCVLQDAWPTTSGLNRWHVWTVAPYLRLDSNWSEYHDSLKKGLRADNRRQIRRLEQQGELSFREYDALSEVLQLFHRLTDQKSQRFLATGAVDPLKDGRILAFYKDVVSRLWQSGHIHVSTLNIGDHPIAVHFGFICGQRYFYYLPSFDSNFSNFSPGRLLLFNLIRNSFHQGLREFDFLNGPEAYKYDWTIEEHQVYELIAFRRTPRGIGIYAAYKARQRARSSVLIRKGVRWVRKHARTSNR